MKPENKLQRYFVVSRDEWTDTESVLSSQGSWVRADEAEACIAELEAENARLRGALNYYAEKKHYVQFPFLLGPCTEDGEIARKALGGEG